MRTADSFVIGQDADNGATPGAASFRGVGERFPTSRHEAVFATLLFSFGGANAAVFASRLAACFTAAQRLICARRRRSRASELSFLRFFLFWTIDATSDSLFDGRPGLRLIGTGPAKLKRA